MTARTANTNARRIYFDYVAAMEVLRPDGRSAIRYCSLIATHPLFHVKLEVSNVPSAA